METMIHQNNVRSLAQAYGIQLEWQDIWGNTHPVTDDMCKAILSAMEVHTNTQENIDAAFERLQYATVARWLEPVQVVSETEAAIAIVLNIPHTQTEHTFHWTLTREDGQVQQGEVVPIHLPHLGDVELAVQHDKVVRYKFMLTGDLPMGYHRFGLSKASGEPAVEMLLVVTPSRCYLPPILQDEPNQPLKKIWGPAVQLYAIHSKRNWGVGDFGDLTRIVDWCAEQGAAIVGLNPLHALYPHNPSHASPYSPSSRLFFNVTLLDVTGIADFEESAPARQLVLSPDFQAALERLREESMVPYAEVGQRKLDVLKLLYQNFRENHWAQNTERAKAFAQYIQAQGKLLERFALFHALQERFHKEDASIWGWPVWPEAYRSPESPAVQEYLKSNGEQVAFYQYLQWQIDLQLQQAGQRCLEKQLGVGLYMDMAVGVDRGGADVWANQHLFAQSSAVGAPPDEYNQKGQDWGLPPMIPEKMREEAYESFIGMLRQNMKHAGALRIDHVMGLMRLFLIPPGLPPSQGAYIHYPVDELFGILALESQRNRCMVIGEDMGTVPEVVRDRMDRWGVFSYKVFYFEKNHDHYKAPEEYQSNAAVAVSTHDLPTLSGFWQGQDITVRTALDLYPNPELRERQIKDRVMERMAILNLLEQRGLLPEGINAGPLSAPMMTPELSAAIHRLVSQTNSKLFMVQFEDMLQQIDQINLPGTTDPVYPCWKRKITLPLEEYGTDHRILSVCQAIATERPKTWKGDIPEAERKKKA
ncbi:4-alpha-glucanotransferase [Vampirovibrio chlorellavorus]|uniref:4-alpha-glucanotransferase n=1 Tax=Vampirovibrio chlorellavorus TaxID=758823 RepID=UPI0026EDB8D0|nr:4-alpha-glucanotransferase [Vampirovibrio chlorellavorus]